MENQLTLVIVGWFILTFVTRDLMGVTSIFISFQKTGRDAQNFLSELKITRSKWARWVIISLAGVLFFSQSESSYMPKTFIILTGLCLGMAVICHFVHQYITHTYKSSLRPP